jgi:hypothetical protein
MIRNTILKKNHILSRSSTFQSQEYFRWIREERMADVEGIWFYEYCNLYLDGYYFNTSIRYNLTTQSTKIFKYYFKYVKCNRLHHVKA